MEIPAFFATYRHPSMMVTDGYLTAVSPKMGKRFLPLNEMVSQGLDKNERSPVVIIDCDSFEEKEFSEKVMKHMRISGADVWFYTYIETVEDVFDAFNKDAALVLAPYHFIRSDGELMDICEVSDSVVPVVSIHKGRAIISKRKSGDVLEVLEKLVRMGFYRNFVLDSENSLDQYTWSVIAEDYPSTIPIVNDPNQVKGFQSVITPFLI